MTDTPDNDNARLVAAAPEMLEALKGISEDAKELVLDAKASIQEGGPGYWLQKWQAVLDAIAKAEGRQ